MTDAKRTLPVILVHFVLGFVLCLVYAFVRSTGVDLIAPFINGYRFRSAVLLFVQYMPALQISGLLVGYALAFGKSSGGPVGRWSPELLTTLKGAFLLCLLCVSLYVVLSEGFTPYLSFRQMEVSERTESGRIAKKPISFSRKSATRLRSPVGMGPVREAVKRPPIPS